MRGTLIRTVAMTILLLGAAGAAGVFAARAQGQDILPALLIEVRGLRGAMERMAEAGPRVQLALGRLQLQEQRVNTTVRRLEDVRSKLNNAQRELMVFTDRIKEGEELRDGAPAARQALAPPGGEAPTREQLEMDIASAKRDAALKTADVQRLLAEEAAVSADLATEQGRWTEINQRLEELEQSLGRR